MGAPRWNEPGRDGHRGDAGRPESARAGARRPRPRGGRLRDARAIAPGHADGGADAAAAGRADDVRAQGRGLARRGARRRRAAARARGSGPRGGARRSRRDPLGARRPRRRGLDALRPRARPRRGDRALACEPRARRRARRRAADRGGGAREDRARSAAPRPDRGRRGQGGWRGRRVVGDAAQAQPRRLDVDEGRAPRSPAAMLPCSSARSSASTSAARAAWQAEWEALSGALATTGGAAAALAGALEGLEVDEARMRENLALTGGLVAAERLALVLTERVGRTAARELVRDASLRAAASGRPARRGARGRRHGAHAPTRSTAALDPTTYLGSAGALVDRALARYEAERSRRDDA